MSENMQSKKKKKDDYHSPTIKLPNMVDLGREINTCTVKDAKGHNRDLQLVIQQLKRD